MGSSSFTVCGSLAQDNNGFVLPLADQVDRGTGEFADPLGFATPNLIALATPTVSTCTPAASPPLLPPLPLMPPLPLLPLPAAPPFPPPPPPSTETVVLTIQASGSVSDYSDADRSALKSSIAANAGVKASLVSITVEAASVIITATVAVPASTTATAVQASLSSSFGTAAAASTALGITVESVPTIAVAAPLDSGDGGLALGAIIGIAVAAGAVVLVLAIAAAYIMMKTGKHKASQSQQPAVDA